MSTSVPRPTFGPRGFTAPPEEEILAGIAADIDTAFGGGTNPALYTPQGQMASSETAILGYVNDTFLFFTQQVDPSFAQGRMQDAIARIYFLERIPSSPTVLQVVCTGLVGVVISEGALVQDTSGNSYVCTAGGEIPITGTIVLPFANLTPGPVVAPTTVIIYTSIPGWDSAAVSSSVLGSNVETQSEFETRRALSVAANSVGALPSIVGRILEVPGVIDAFVTENNLNVTRVIGGFTLAANSLYAAVTGGSALDVATAIWRGALCCSYNGNTAVVVEDTNSGYSPPRPQYVINFEIPPSLRVLFSVVVVNSPSVPADAVMLIRGAIISAFSGGDGGQRARIGALLLASRFYAPVALLGAWAQIVDIEIGSANDSTVAYTGSIAGSVLTVSAVVSGVIAVGDTIIDDGGLILPGTTIISQTSGATGGAGVYVVANSQTIVSSVLRSVQPDDFKIAVQINQQPTVAAADIAVTLA